MQKAKRDLTIVATIFFIAANAAAKNPAPGPDIQQALNAHYQKYKALEYFSGAALSVYVPNRPIQNYYVGYSRHDANSAPITADTLFEIGSITKSFTAATLLQLEGTAHFGLDDTLGHWLQGFEKWSDVRITDLLNMTSGLPNYSDSPLMNAAEYQSPARVWDNNELLSFVYPPGDFSPPRKTGYFYTNTGYILAGLVAEKVSGKKFNDLLIEKTIRPAKLTHTFYPIPTITKDVSARLAHGYNYNQYDNPLLVGQDMYRNNLTWAGAAGAMVSNTEDIVLWTKALFVEDVILTPSQKKSLMQTISTNTGKPLLQTTLADAHGFGLGIAQAYDSDLKLRFWFYQGETLGFRAVYIYVPCNGVIISTIFNSATNEENNHIGQLIKQVYKLILQQGAVKSCTG